MEKAESNESNHIWLADERLTDAIARWRHFERTLHAEERIGIIFHADIDGVIGAAYACAVLGNRRVTPSVLWVRTDEYDFREVKEWIATARLQKCLVFDVSLAGDATTMRCLEESVTDSVFIFDHHLLPAPVNTSEKVAVVNPTPAPLALGQIPTPTFAFALRLAREADLEFPDWLLLLGIFGEGVDSFVPDLARRLLFEQFRVASAGNLRQGYRQTRLPAVLGCVRAEFAADPKGHETLTALQAVALGRLTSFQEFAGRLEHRFGPEARRISKAISNAVDDWQVKIAKDLKEDRVVAIPVATPEIAGPVASILRGHFPHKVIVTFTNSRQNVTFELRTSNESRANLPAVLERVNGDIPAISFGGHPSAAGALVDSALAESFRARLVRELDRTFSSL